MNEPPPNLFARIMTDPKMIVAGAIAGFVIGYFFKSLGRALAPYGAFYISLLAMCVLPMMTTAIISGLGRMLRSRETRGCFRRLILTYALGLMVPASLGILAAWVGQPGVGLDEKALTALGSMVLSAEETVAPPSTSLSFFSFITRIVPENVFAAYSEGRVVSIIFLSILIGLAFGLIRFPRARDALDVVQAVYHAFELIFAWFVHLLPVGMFCLIAGLMSSFNLMVLSALVKYMIVFSLAAICLLALYHCLLWRLLGGPFALPFKALKEPLFLSFIANNSIITIPACLEAVKDRMAVDDKISEIVVPFGIIANRHGVIFLFAYTTVFLAQIYGIGLNADNLPVTGIASILTGMAAEGHGAAIAPLLSEVLRELMIPAVLGPVVLTVTFGVIGRLENMITIYATSLLALWVGKAGTSGTPETEKSEEEELS